MIHILECEIIFSLTHRECSTRTHTHTLIDAVRWCYVSLYLSCKNDLSNGKQYGRLYACACERSVLLLYIEEMSRSFRTMFLFRLLHTQTRLKFTTTWKCRHIISPSSHWCNWFTTQNIFKFNHLQLVQQFYMKKYGMIKVHSAIVATRDS